MDKNLGGEAAESAASTSKSKALPTLFGVIQYNDIDSLDTFISGINVSNAFLVITAALKAAQNRGAFTLEESETVSKTLRVIQQAAKAKSTESHQPAGDPSEQ